MSKDLFLGINDKIVGYIYYSLPNKSIESLQKAINISLDLEIYRNIYKPTNSTLNEILPCIGEKIIDPVYIPFNILEQEWIKLMGKNLHIYNQNNLYIYTNTLCSTGGTYDCNLINEINDNCMVCLSLGI